MNKKLIFTLILTLFLIGIFISASSADLNDNNLGITDDDAENVDSPADDNAVDATDDNADSQYDDDDMLKTSDDDNILNADEKKNITVTIKTQEGTTFPNVQLSLVLYRNGQAVGECTLPNSNNDDPHKHTFTNLDVNDANGNPYRYTFDEVKVNGYDVRQGFVDDNGTSYDIVLSEVTGGKEQPQDEPPAETPDNNDTDPDNNGTDPDNNKTNPDNNNTDTNEDKETNQDNNKTTDTQDNKNPTTTTKTTETTTTVTKTTPDKEKQNNTTANAQKDNNTKIKDNKNTGYPIAILVAVLAVIGITFALRRKD